MPQRIEPGGTAGITVVFDPAHDPDFQGSLAVDLVGVGAFETVCFQTKAKVEVRPRLAS
jgi:hypothetical protein